jgi:hypothetical protein
MAQHTHRPLNLQGMQREKPGGCRNAGERNHSQDHTGAQTSSIALNSSKPEKTSLQTRNTTAHLELVVYQSQTLNPQTPKSRTPPNLKQHTDIDTYTYTDTDKDKDTSSMSCSALMTPILN